jgi:hypothetical protein
MPTQATVTGVLQAVEQGDREALGTLFDLVYEELNLLAHPCSGVRGTGI